MKKREIIIFVALAVAAAAVLLILNFKGEDNSKRLIITVDGEEYKNILLTEETNMQFTIETVDGYNEINISSGVVDVISADCPTQVCVETKAASGLNDKIVCLPHKVVIEVVGANGETD